MSLNDIYPRETGGRNSIPTDRWVTASGQTELIEAGEPAKVESGSVRNGSILLEDADLTIGSDQPMTGIAADTSSDTSSASGISNQYVPLPGIMWEIKAQVAANADSQAKIDLLIGELYLIDLDTSVFTIDTAGTATTAAFLCVGGDPDRSTIWFRIRPDAAAFGRATI